jgi:hypothetical protein
MAKKSRSRAYTTRALSHTWTRWTGAAVVTAGLSSTAMAAGLPLRPVAPAADAAVSVLAEGLSFKLARLEGSQGRTWAMMVEDALLLAGRLGFAAEMPIEAQQVGNTYVVLLRGEGFLAGADADRVLGRLVFELAHVHAETASPVSLSILDQPLSVTLRALSAPSSTVLSQ